MLCESLTKCRRWQHAVTVRVVWIQLGGIRILGRGPTFFLNRALLRRNPALESTGPQRAKITHWPASSFHHSPMDCSGKSHCCHYQASTITQTTITFWPTEQSPISDRMLAHKVTWSATYQRRTNQSLRAQRLAAHWSATSQQRPAGCDHSRETWTAAAWSCCTYESRPSSPPPLSVQQHSFRWHAVLFLVNCKWRWKKNIESHTTRLFALHYFTLHYMIQMIYTVMTI